MSKRFTDTDKWDDVWFQELPSAYQKFWLYICDKCDCAGVWKVNKSLAEFQLKETLDLQVAISLFNDGKERIKKLSDGKWFITGFIRYQVTTLRRYDSGGKINRVHAPIYASLESNGIDPSFYELEEKRGSTEAPESLLARQEQDKEKDKEKQGDEGLVLLSLEERQKLQGKMGAKKTHEYIQKLENYIGSKGRKYKSHYFTILSWWHKDGSPKDPIKVQPVKFEKPEVYLSDDERKSLIKSALPNYGVKV